MDEKRKSLEKYRHTISKFITVIALKKYIWTVWSLHKISKNDLGRHSLQAILVKNIHFRNIFKIWRQILLNNSFHASYRILTRFFKILDGFSFILFFYLDSTLMITKALVIKAPNLPPIFIGEIYINVNVKTQCS